MGQLEPTKVTEMKSPKGKEKKLAVHGVRKAKEGKCFW